MDLVYRWHHWFPHCDVSLQVLHRGGKLSHRHHQSPWVLVSEVVNYLVSAAEWYWMRWQDAVDHQGLVGRHQAGCSTEPMPCHQHDTGQTVTGSHELSHPDTLRTTHRHPQSTDCSTKPTPCHRHDTGQAGTGSHELSHRETHPDTLTDTRTHQGPVNKTTEPLQ